ncbi:MAG: S-layer homology domain-containing protein [Eubacteriales bacterium]
MRNLKRFLAMTLTMLMVIGCFSFASFAQDFDDVYDYADAIDVLSDLGVIWGYEDGTFGPDNTVERWHMSLWIAKMETGKVTTDDYLTIWRAEENYTDFTDVAVDQAIGAINYAADEAIIIGTSATTFAPTAGIMYQDALTMVVRALGFGGKTMDAGYPWKYINKAAELGLEDGITGVAYKDVLTRAETAQILYNALYTVDASGKTYVSDVFGLSTVVITGTPAYKITQTEAVIKTGFVSFNILNADGTINTDVTYHLPATAFGLTAANADNYVGASFKVTTKNNFKTLGIVIANPSEVFAANDIVGAGTAAAPSALLTLDGTSYQAVNKFSALYNTQGIKGNTDEILVYTTNLTQSTADGYFKVDANYNVLDAAGHIVAYYAPAITGSYAAPYVKLLGNSTYTPFANNNDNQKASILAAGGVWNAAVQNTYAQSVNTYDLVKNNKYATAVAYDDNADGMYDRLFYTYQEFTQISYDAATLKYNVNGGQVAVAKFIDGTTGEALAAAPAGYIRYSYNPLSKYLTVYETYTYGTGLVTTVNTAAQKIVIGGTQYTVGFGNFPGAAYANSGVGLSLVGKQVNFVLVDGVVVRVFDAAVATSYIVYDNMTGITSQGYGTALVYVQAPTATVITIATINGYSFQQYWLFAQQGSLANIMPLETGNFFIGTKDALGFWHLQTQAYNYSLQQEQEVSVSVLNGIVFENGVGTGTGFTPAMAAFETSADTVYIVYDATHDRFYTRKGVPTDGSAIGVDGGLFLSIPAANTANFMYANEGWFSNFNIQAAPPVFASSDTVIYVNRSAAPTLITNNIGTTGTLLGNTYQYGNVLDMITGKLVTVQANYNFTLEGGCFYRVYNGYIEGKVIPDSTYNEVNHAAIDITTGWLRSYTAYSSGIDTALVAGQTADNNVTSTKTYIFKLISGDVELVDGALVNRAVTAPLAAVNSKVYFYTGGQTSNRVMLIDETFTNAIVVPSTPAITGSVEINGGIFVGNILTAVTAGTPAGATLKYQWMKSTFIDGGMNYQPITGATGSTWTLLADDFSSYIKVVVTAVDYSGSITSLPIGPIHAHGSTNPLT